MPDSFNHGYALLIGVGTTEYDKWALPVTVKDAEALQQVLINPALCGYPEDADHIRFLHDTTATRQGIEEALAWLQTRVQADPDATIVVYYSGHGWVDPTTQQYYLIPQDTEPTDVASTALPGETFTMGLRAIQAQRLLVILDCCHAGGMATAKGETSAVKLPRGWTATAPTKALVDELKQGAGRAVFLSSLGEQFSWVRPDNTMSIYTYHLIEALQGAGNASGETLVEIANLMNYLSKTVPATVQAAYKAEQTPFFDTATQNFPIALVQGGKGLPAKGWEPDPRILPSPLGSSSVVQASGAGSVAVGGNVTGSNIVTGNNNITNQGTMGAVQTGSGTQFNIGGIRTGRDSYIGSTVNQHQHGGVRFGDNATVHGIVAGGDITTTDFNPETRQQLKTLLDQFADEIDTTRDLSRTTRTEVIQQAEAAKQQVDLPGARQMVGQRLQDMAQTLKAAGTGVAGMVSVYEILKQAGKLVGITLP